MALCEEYVPEAMSGRQTSGARRRKSTFVNSLTAKRLTDVGLEEVVFDYESDQWLITIGFSRPWVHPKALSAALREDPLKRSYKVVRINDADGKVLSLKDRVLTAAG